MDFLLKIRTMSLPRGAVAQLIERRIRIAEVRGLNPLSSTMTTMHTLIEFAHKAPLGAFLLHLGRVRTLCTTLHTHQFKSL